MINAGSAFPWEACVGKTGTYQSSGPHSSGTNEPDSFCSLNHHASIIPPKCSNSSASCHHVTLPRWPGLWMADDTVGTTKSSQPRVPFHFHPGSRPPVHTRRTRCMPHSSAQQRERPGHVTNCIHLHLGPVG